MNCVVYIYSDERIWAMVWLVLAVAWGFATGIMFHKAQEIVQLNKFIANREKAYKEFIAEMEKAEENRPFKEFDKSSDVPFPEVRNKE